MATYTKLKLSGSTDGKAIKVAATATPGTTIHTAHATALDEIWIWAMNNHTADVILTIEYGGTSDPDDLIETTIPYASGLVPITPGLLLTNSLVVKAYAGVADVISLFGFANRIT